MLLGVSNATRTPDSDSGLGLWSQQRNHTRRVAGSTDLARTQRGRQLLHDLARCSLHGLRCGVALLPHLALALQVEEHVARSVDDLVRMTVHRRQERIRRQEDVRGGRDEGLRLVGGAVALAQVEGPHALAGLRGADGVALAL